MRSAKSGERATGIDTREEIAVAGPATPCPTCGMVSRAVRCPRCNTLKLASCSGSCRTCAARCDKA